MAFCGANFSTKEEEKKTEVDTSLQNVRAFSTKKGQISSTSQEGLHVMDKNSKPVDNRIAIQYKSQTFNRNSFWGLGQVTCKVPGGTGVGTGSLIKLNSTLHCLTCAHNLVNWNVLEKKAVVRSSPLFFMTRQGEKRWGVLNQLDEKSVRVHPKYNGEPHCGFDFAVAPFALDLGPQNYTAEFYDANPKKVDIKWHNPNPKDLQIGMELEIGGYPGEKEGYPYYHKGTIQRVTKTNLGGYLLWYNVDTTPGNSGSPINITNKKYVEKYSTLGDGIEKLTIGVHTGACDDSGLNFGTLQTTSIKKWMVGSEGEGCVIS